MENWQRAGFGLYVHWPFCAAKCPYCDFNSHVTNFVDQKRWRAALLAELEYWADRVGPRVLSSIFLTSDALVKIGLEKSFYDDSKVTQERIDYYHQPLRTNHGQRAAMRARQQFTQFPVEDKLSGINKPTLIIWGAEDEVIPLSAGRKMNSLIKNSEMIVYEKVGHIPQEEVPERFLSDIINFIEYVHN